MKTFIIILLLIPSLCLADSDKWDNEALSLLSIATISTVIDWGQTRDIVKNNKEDCTLRKNNYERCDYYYEKTNIYLGKKPSISEVDTYMPLAIITTGAIAHFLPKDMRKKFLYGVSFLELGTIYNNHKIGLKINF